MVLPPARGDALHGRGQMSPEATRRTIELTMAETLRQMVELQRSTAEENRLPEASGWGGVG